MVIVNISDHVLQLGLLSLLIFQLNVFVSFQSVATAMRHEGHLAASPDLSGQHRVNRGTNPRYSSANQVGIKNSK